MKPVANSERNLKDSHRVIVIPTHEGGHFVVNDNYYGKKVVGRIVLSGVLSEDVRALDQTGEFPLDKYVCTDVKGVSTLAAGKFEARIPVNHFTPDHVVLTVDRFQEFAPVTAQVPVLQ